MQNVPGLITIMKIFPKICFAYLITCLVLLTGSNGQAEEADAKSACDTIILGRRGCEVGDFGPPRLDEDYLRRRSWNVSDFDFARLDEDVLKRQRWDVTVHDILERAHQHCQMAPTFNPIPVYETPSVHNDEVKSPTDQSVSPSQKPSNGADTGETAVPTYKPSSRTHTQTPKGKQ